MSQCVTRCFTVLAVSCAALVACAGHAHGSIIFLSTNSSDSTSASLLSASMDFSISGSTLTLTVSNNTSAPNEFKMNEIYFNSAPTLTGLTLLSPPSGWNLHTNIAADGFGVYDFGLIDGVGQNPAQIPAGGSQIFTFQMTGSAVESDFVTYFSSIPPGSTPAIVAAKFVGGPDDDSAYGATVPAPVSSIPLALLAMGARRRRR